MDAKRAVVQYINRKDSAFSTREVANSISPFSFNTARRWVRHFANMGLIMITDTQGRAKLYCKTESWDRDQRKYRPPIVGRHSDLWWEKYEEVVRRSGR